VRSPDAIMISVAAIGSQPHGTMVRRSGAQVGDHVVITGTIGDAALGLRLRQDSTATQRWLLRADQHEHLARRYLLPEPRTAIADAVRAHASGAMDVSDGLAGDLTKLCRASGVSARIDVARVPLSAAARTAITVERGLMEAVLTGGDDYEVLATVPPGKLATMRAAAAHAGVALTEIGTVIQGRDAPQFTLHDQPLKFAQRSFSHF
jgi:thiamine-monophosphate kinase